VIVLQILERINHDAVNGRIDDPIFRYACSHVGVQLKNHIPASRDWGQDLKRQRGRSQVVVSCVDLVRIADDNEIRLQDIRILDVLLFEEDIKRGKHRQAFLAGEILFEKDIQPRFSEHLTINLHAKS